MRFSVVIPVYNVASYLRDCLDSIICAAKRVEDVEIVCVDDGSTDDSLEILKSYKGLKIYSQPNQGVSVARNSGLDMATGDWISFVDPDDWIDEDYFSRVENVVSNAKALDVVVFGYVVESFDGKMIKNPCVDVAGRVLTGAEALLESRGGVAGAICLLWNKVYRRSVIQKNEIRFVPGLKYDEDVVFACQTVSRCDGVFLLSGFCPYHVRQRKGSATQVARLEDNLSHVAAAQSLAQFGKIYESGALRVWACNLSWSAIKYACGTDLRSQWVEILTGSPLFTQSWLQYLFYHSDTRKKRLVAFFLCVSPKWLSRCFLRLV